MRLPATGRFWILAALMYLYVFWSVCAALANPLSLSDVGQLLALGPFLLFPFSYSIWSISRKRGTRPRGDLRQRNHSVRGMWTGGPAILFLGNARGGWRWKSACVRYRACLGCQPFSSGRTFVGTCKGAALGRCLFGSYVGAFLFGIASAVAGRSGHDRHRPLDLPAKFAQCDLTGRRGSFCRSRANRCVGGLGYRRAALRSPDP